MENRTIKQIKKDYETAKNEYQEVYKEWRIIDDKLRNAYNKWASAIKELEKHGIEHY